MAVCGHCWICGWKFSCNEKDEAGRFFCTACGHDHKICAPCHEALSEGGDDTRRILLDLVRIVRDRRAAVKSWEG
jgi:hypothetical protein